MVPFWGKQLFVRVALLTGLSVVLLAVVWSISQSPGQVGNGLAQAKPRPEAKVEPEPARPPQDAKPSAPPTVVVADKPPSPPALEVGPTEPPKPAPPAAEDAADKPPKPNPPAAEVPAEKPPKPNPPPEDPPAKPEAKGKEVRGTVRTLDVQKRTVTLRVGEKREAAYRLAQNARITGGANNMALRDIRPGTRVRATLGDGDMIVELNVDRGRERPREGDRRNGD
jgi:hypothetical protein